ncbi:MAG: AAA family ATPase [Desulfobacterales bacterium]|nr:AAA family ATPase [Desulfobacterales bacterium]
MESKYPVQTVDDAYDVCDPEESLGYGDERYVEVSDVRGTINFARTISLRIKRTKSPDFHRQLITGHRGCGKSTELRQLREELKKMKYFTIFLDVEEVLDLGEINYLDVLLAISRSLFEHLDKEEIQISQKLLDDIEKWFADKIQTIVKATDFEGGIGGEFGMGSKIPLLGKLLFSLTAKIKSASSQRTEIRHVLQRNLGEFTNALNLLIQDARDNIKPLGYQDIVIIIDGLEKMLFQEKDDGTSNHFEMFILHAEQLKSPTCHVIYTVPIWLSFHAQLGDSFADTPYVIPMVKYDTDEGRDRLFKMISKRLDMEAVFRDKNIIQDFISMSGGSFRDLFRLIRMSCDGVEDKISKDDAQRATDELVRNYDALLREEDVDKLIQVAKDKIIPTPVGYDWLLNRRLIHEYQNGERWADLHPAIRSNKRIQRRLNE